MFSVANVNMQRHINQNLELNQHLLPNVSINIVPHSDNRYFEILVWWKLVFSPIHIFIIEQYIFSSELNCIVFLTFLTKSDSIRLRWHFLRDYRSQITIYEQIKNVQKKELFQIYKYIGMGFWTGYKCKR